MFSPEYTEVDSTRFSLDIETFSNHLEYGKVDLQVSSLHNSGAFFFFFPFTLITGRVSGVSLHAPDPQTG